MSDVLSRNRAYNPREVAEEVNALGVRLDTLETLAVSDAVGAGTITKTELAVGALAADATGRAVMADDYFNAATVLAKFDADSFDNAQLILAIKDGAFNADAATRALFDAGIWTETYLDPKGVSEVSLAARVRGEPQALTGPGAVNLTTPVTRVTTTGSNDALTLADSTIAGQRKTIIHAVDGGSWRLTAGGSLHLGDSLATITSTTVRDWVTLEWSEAGQVWNVIAWGGAGVTFA